MIYNMKRVYRWNACRFLMNLFVLMLIIGLLFLIFSGSTKANTAPTSVIVRSGETLWTIALKVHPDIDPRKTIQEIQDANHLDSVTVQPGQYLIVP